MTKQQKQEVTIKPKAEVVVASMSSVAENAHKAFEGSAVNLIIPRLMVKNEGSTHLAPYNLDDGDIVDTLNYQTLAKLGDKISMVPFHSRSIWIVSEVDKKGEEFVGYEDFTGERLPYEEDAGNGVTTKRSLGIQVFMLICSEIAEGVAMPYAFTFKKSSATAGKKLNTIMYMKNKMAKRAPWASVIDFFSIERSHAKGEYCTVDIQQNNERGANQAELDAAEFWYNKMVSNEITVDEATGEIVE